MRCKKSRDSQCHGIAGLCSDCRKQKEQHSLARGRSSDLLCWSRKDSEKVFVAHRERRWKILLVGYAKSQSNVCDTGCDKVCKGCRFIEVYS